MILLQYFTHRKELSRIFEEDSDDDNEWNPNEEEDEENEETYCCKSCSYTTKHEILLTRHTLTTRKS